MIKKVILAKSKGVKRESVSNSGVDLSRKCPVGLMVLE